MKFIVNIYPLKNDLFLASFTHPLTKKKIRKRFDSKLNARSYKLEMEQKFTCPKVDSFKELTLSELMVIYNIECPDNKLVKSKRAHLEDFLETFGSCPIESICSDELKQWFDLIQRENKLKNITMRGVKCDIDGFFKFLVEKDVISQSPLTAIYYEKSTPALKSRNLLSPSEIEKLLVAIKDYSPGYLYPLIKFFAETAAKTMEAASLTWKDIDLEKGLVHFEKTTASQERTLKISDELVSILKKKKASKGYLFTTYYNEPFTKNKIRRAIIEFKVKGNYQSDWCPMDLRHSFAVNFLTEGCEIKELQYILGHLKLADTKKLYGEALTQKLACDFTNPMDQETPISYQI